MSDVKVFYIGKKPMKKDTVAGTNHVWRGHGSYRLVAEAAAQRLFDFPSVWMNEDDFKKFFGDEGEGASAGLADLPVVSAPPAAQTDNTSQPEPHEATPVNLIHEAIRKLDRADKEHFGSNGIPKIDAVRAQLPEEFVLDAKALNEAFAQIKDEFRA